MNKKYPPPILELSEGSVFLKSYREDLILQGGQRLPQCPLILAIELVLSIYT